MESEEAGSDEAVGPGQHFIPDLPCDFKCIPVPLGLMYEVEAAVDCRGEIGFIF